MRLRCRDGGVVCTWLEETHLGAPEDPENFILVSVLHMKSMD